MYTIQVPGEPGDEARCLGNHLVLVPDQKETTVCTDHFQYFMLKAIHALDDICGRD